MSEEFEKERDKKRNSPCFGIPDADGGVQSSRGDPHPVKCYRIHLVQMTLQDMDALPCIDIP